MFETINNKQSEKFGNEFFKIYEIIQSFTKMELSHFDDILRENRKIAKQIDIAFQNFPQLPDEVTLKFTKELGNIHAVRRTGFLDIGKTKIMCIYSLNKELVKRIKLVDFEVLKIEGKCNCDVKQSIHLAPDEETSKHLSLIYKMETNVEIYSVYQCDLCDLKWVEEALMDDTGGYRWMKWNEKDFPILE